MVSYLDGTFKEIYGASFVHDPEPASQAAKISQHVTEKRATLGIN
jgi:hypothetical protein